MTLALIGNPNCGKTTLFNLLTGAHSHVGNFPGVTVSAKTGEIRAIPGVSLVDLPGVYSLCPYSADERVSLDFLLNGRPDGIISIVDATCLVRSLYLTLILLELGIPTVVALNMMDDVEKNGGRIDVCALSHMLGVPCVAISAGKGKGIDVLLDTVSKTMSSRTLPSVRDNYGDIISSAVSEIRTLTDPIAQKAGMPCVFCAMSVLASDEYILSRMSFDRKKTDEIVSRTKKLADGDIYSLIAEKRYGYIEKAVAKCSVLPGVSRIRRRSERIDALLTNRYLSLPVFFTVMITVFYLTFDAIGARAQAAASLVLSLITDAADGIMAHFNVHCAVRSLVSDGIFEGVGSVISFLPVILILFFFLSLLEDSGYMARVAFITDGLFRCVGLSGRSFVPMLMGFGCSVPAIIASRTLPSERDRKVTLLLLPYISCSAKIPVYSLFAAAFFARARTFIICELYIIGIFMGVIVSLILKKLYPVDESSSFMLELPDYRLPTLKNVAVLMWEKTKDFICRAFTLILIASVCIWFFSYFDVSFSHAADISDSILYHIGDFISPVFRPLGFGRAELATALVVGLSAKETVVSTLGVLSGGGGIAQLFGNRISAFSFLLFTLLYTPCVAAFAAMRSELGSFLRALGVAFIQCAAAYLVSFLFYNIACILI